MFLPGCELWTTPRAGAVSRQVSVTAEAPLLESATASVGQVIDSRRVQDLPMPALSVIYLASLHRV